MRAFSPNAIASYFCGTAFLDCWETFHHADARGIAESVGEFIVQRLNRPVDMEQQLCFGYTPTSRGIIYNASALAGAFLARLASHDGKSEYYGLARRCMSFLVAAQRKDGSWPYGANHRQRWIDHFHTGYNLCALLEYSRCSGDHSFGAAVERGYDFYKRKFFTHDGIPKYFQNGLYPIDIHSCSQAILTFAAFADRDPSASECALRTAIWSVQNMQRNDRAFYYQRHRFWTNRAPYMRWGQAWMFRALSGLELASRKVSS
jgi:hypothetical protein